MESFIYKKYFELVHKNCFGCVNNKPSQKDHLVCLDSSFHFNFFIEVLNKLLEEGKISTEFYDQILLDAYVKNDTSTY